MIIISIIAFLMMVVLVVAVHEWGHYAAARLFGVRVLRFSVGFGTPLFKKTDAAGTEWALAPIPLGGYVHLLDAATARQIGADEQETMEAQSNWRRFIIYAAGPLANIVLSVIILSAIFVNGESGIVARIGSITPNSPAEHAGLAAGDKISSINGESTLLWSHAIVVLFDAILAGEAIDVETVGGSQHNIVAGAVPAAAVEEGLLSDLGLIPDLNYVSQTIEVVKPNSPADRGGILAEDVIVAIDGVVADNWTEAAQAIKVRPGQEVSIVLWRATAAVTALVTLESVQVDEDYRIGRLGITPRVDNALLDAMLLTVHLSLPAAVVRATQKSLSDMVRTFQFLGHIIGGNLSFEKNVSGPVGIARSAGQAASIGWAAWWGFVALISVSLAAINLLPLPILDGGRMLICVVQAILRRPLAESLLEKVDRVGIMLLLILMAFAITADLFNLF